LNRSDGGTEGSNAMAWKDYKETARERGALAFECYVVTSLLVEGKAVDHGILKQHLAYIAEQEELGTVMFAGPLSDETGEDIVGGMLIMKTADMQKAEQIAANDPIHLAGIRRFSVRRWLINEGGLSVTFNLGAQKVAIA